MIREDFIKLQTQVDELQRVLNGVKGEIIGCGKYFKVQDRYCGHRYNWKGKPVFTMDVWLCDKCKEQSIVETNE